MGRFASVAILVSLVAAAGLHAVATTAAPGSVACPPLQVSGSAGGSVVGVLTDVLHSRVYLDKKYVGAPPVNITAGSRVCTDAKGQAVFNLSASKKATKCIVLPKTVLQASPPSLSPRLTLNFEAGNLWCSIRRTDGYFGAPYVAPNKRVRFIARTSSATLVGIVVDERVTTIKVSSGYVYVAARSRAIVGPQRQVTIDARGIPGRPTKLVLAAQERIALAKFRLLP
jgi:hypothetical protein